MKNKSAKLFIIILGIILIALLIGKMHSSLENSPTTDSKHKIDPVVKLLHAEPSLKTSTTYQLQKNGSNAACAEAWDTVIRLRAQDLYEQMKSLKFTKSNECSALEANIFPNMEKVLQQVCQSPNDEHRCVEMLIVYRACILGRSIPDGDPRSMKDDEVLAKVVSHTFSTDPRELLQARNYADELRRRFPESSAANHAYFSASNLALSLGQLQIETFQKDLLDSANRNPDDHSLQQLYLETPSPNTPEEWAEKASHIKNFIEDNPGNYLGPYEQASILFHAQDVEGAMSQLQEAIKLAPTEEQERLQWVMKRVQNGDKAAFSSGFGFAFDDLTN